MHDKPSIFIASDHAGYIFKSYLCNFLQQKGYLVKDLGSQSRAPVDYPHYAHRLADAVCNSPNSMGVLLCGTGNGMAMAANQHEGIRAAVCWNKALVKLARQHNDANVLCLPARFINQQESETLLLCFLHTRFAGGRHARRIQQIPLFTTL